MVDAYSPKSRRLLTDVLREHDRAKAERKHTRFAPPSFQKLPVSLWDAACNGVLHTMREYIVASEECSLEALMRKKKELMNPHESNHFKSLEHAFIESVVMHEFFDFGARAFAVRPGEKELTAMLKFIDVDPQDIVQPNAGKPFLALAIENAHSALVNHHSQLRQTPGGTWFGGRG